MDPLLFIISISDIPNYVEKVNMGIGLPKIGYWVETLEPGAGSYHYFPRPSEGGWDEPYLPLPKP